MGSSSDNTADKTQGMDKCERRAWCILLVVFAIFMICLVMVSFWGGPFEADSYWLQEEPPTYPN